MPTRLATCGALALVLALAACGGGEAASSAPPAPVPTPVPEPEERVCLGGASEPAGQGELVPREQACPDDEPSSAPSPAVVWDLADAYLPPEAAAEAEQPGWSVVAPFEPEPGPVLDPCGEDAFPRSEAIEASAERALGSEREAGGSGLLQEVFRYSSAQAAADAFAAYADAVERCPETADPAAEGQAVRHEVVRAEQAGDVQRLLVRRSPCTGPGMCPPQFTSYYLVAQAADGLTAVDYGIGEDGDPVEPARDLLVAVAAQLEAAVRG